MGMSCWWLIIFPQGPGLFLKVLLKARLIQGTPDSFLTDHLSGFWSAAELRIPGGIKHPTRQSHQNSKTLIHTCGLQCAFQRYRPLKKQQQWILDCFQGIGERGTMPVLICSSYGFIVGCQTSSWRLLGSRLSFDASKLWSLGGFTVTKNVWSAGLLPQLRMRNVSENLHRSVWNWSAFFPCNPRQNWDGCTVELYYCFMTSLIHNPRATAKY